jgi:hypothetical protein
VGQSVCDQTKPTMMQCTTEKPQSQKTPSVGTQIRSHDEADTAAHKAILPRIHALPHTDCHAKKIGKLNAHGTALMQPSAFALQHAAAPLLHEYATKGCPVNCGPDWSHERILAALEYGAHPTAKVPQALKCLIEEAEAKVTHGFSRIITWKDIKNDVPKKFKLSPVAMIPHKSKLFRSILDLSFVLRSQRSTTLKSVNEDTIKLAPQQSMNQLGKTLKRIIAALADCHAANRKMMFAKLDIKDGFWRLVVSHEDAWNFCYVIPNTDPNAHIDDTKIVVPNSLQMGWCESPPFFCAASETARDVIASILHTNLPPHPFEERMLPKNFTDLPMQDLQSLMSLIEVYVDDFIACTDNVSQTQLLKLSRAMLHGIHTVFAPPTVTGHNGGDPISEKKLDKLEGLWQTVKEILGWILDGANHTICLPPDKVQKITQLLRRTNKQTKVRLNDFQKLAGVLHHAAYGMPGGRGLFNPLWKAMAKCTNGWVPMTTEIRHTLNDFKWLFLEIANKPINVTQLVPTHPNIHGYCDACKSGAGGVWILPQDNVNNRHVVWATTFPPPVIKKFENHELSINDLEMAGVLIQWLVLEHLLPSLHHLQAGIECDNSSTVVWSRKFTAKSIVAGHLLRALALRQQICGSAPLLVISIAGKLNDMADIASRFASDPAMQKNSPSLLSYFNTHFKQTNSWQEFHLPQKLISRVISSLLGTRLTLESWRRLPGLVKSIGTAGRVTQTPSKSTLYSPTWTPSSATLSLQHSLLGSGKATTGEATKSKYQESLTPFRPSARPSSWLDTKAQSTEHPTPTI